MKAKTLCFFGVLLTFLFVATFFVIDISPEVLVAAGLGYTGVLAAWLGFDFAITRDRTLAMEAGKYAKLHLSRYLFGIFSLAALLFIAIFRDPGGAFTDVKVALIPCVLTPVGILIGAYGANKNATQKHEENK